MLKEQEKKIKYIEDGVYYPVLDRRHGGFVLLKKQKENPEPEQFYDDEERDPNAPNPDMQTDLNLPAEFEFDPAVQSAP